MTVAELIRKLQVCPPHATVVIPEMNGVRGDTYEALVTAQRIAIEGAKFATDHEDGPQWLKDWADRKPSDEPVQIIVVIE